jgi:hypothetical protein
LTEGSSVRAKTNTASPTCCACPSTGSTRIVATAPIAATGISTAMMQGANRLRFQFMIVSSS